VAEGARLESVYTGNRIVGSNPTPSARRRRNANKINMMLDKCFYVSVFVPANDGTIYCPDEQRRIDYDLTKRGPVGGGSKCELLTLAVMFFGSGGWSQNGKSTRDDFLARAHSLVMAGEIFSEGQDENRSKRNLHRLARVLPASISGGLSVPEKALTLELIGYFVVAVFADYTRYL
jgi:hypothetical protein